MKGKEKNNIDEFFRKAFANYEAESSEFIWDKLDKKLSSSETPVLKHAPQARKIRLINFAKLAIKIAATFLIIATAAAATYFTAYTVQKQDLINKIFSKKKQSVPPEKQEIVVITDTSTVEIKQEEERLNVYDDSVGSTLPEALLKDESIKGKQKLSGDVSVEKPKEQKTQSVNASGMTDRKQPPMGSVKNEQAVQEQKPESKVPDKELLKDDEEKTRIDKEQFVTEPFRESRQPVVPGQAETQESSVTLKIPNVFTPNGDGINDLFIIENLSKYSVNRLAIFDRTGKTVFEKINYKNDWDGGTLPEGVYFYIFSAKGKDGSDIVKEGTITIFR